MEGVPLEQFASTMCTRDLKKHPTINSGDTMFAMYTIPALAFLQLTEVKMHEELEEAGLLREFDETMGKAMFVSHQWLSVQHPDPSFEQLKVLQDALRNIASGSSRVNLPIVAEIFHGRSPCPTAADFASDRLHIWYDYFCCPQGRSELAAQNRRHAIESIPAYVARCEFFVVLCPAFKHRDQQRTLSHATWGERGWCRTERVARELATRQGGHMVVVESATHQTLMWATGSCLLDAPGEGEFTLDADRSTIGPMVRQMVLSKLLHYLEHRDLHNYRFLLNSQGARYFRGLEVAPIDGLVPGFQPDPEADEKGAKLDWFLHQNGFRSISEPDDQGWPPICFAAVSGNVQVLQALLERRANVNDVTTKTNKELHLVKKMTPLQMAAFFRNNEAVEFLLSARAEVNNVDGFGGNALHVACLGDNPHAVRLFCQARADPSQEDKLGLNPFQVACAVSSVRAMKEMLLQMPGLSLRHGLHIALMFGGGGSPERISVLLEAKADVNEQFRVKFRETGWWLMLNVMGLRHRVSPSRLTLLAYHHHDATPLMFSILAGSFEAVPCLLDAGARADVQNYRRQKTSDLARQVHAPAWLIEACSDERQRTGVRLDTESDSFFI
ncbi:unnamed protein product [Symbiodinium natans]|uniref:Uncharacterized protein n=1 Tax=Symbiodinium natans TaxID=878477 RepID=A0A812N6Q8_9DINO|nr:unnamed protein product [Symbiodinium natans]